ncbi:MAG: hypothetical protein WDN69_33355 [Aliidongia sp.]
MTGDGTAPGFYQTLPVKVQICETNLLTGQCLSPAAAQVPVSFPSGGTETFTVFVSSLGPAIPDELQEPRLFLRFTEATGAGRTGLRRRSQCRGDDCCAVAELIAAEEQESDGLGPGRRADRGGLCLLVPALAILFWMP